MTTPERPVPFGAGAGTAPTTEQVWYASYGSNMDLARLAYYLCGGRPAGAVWTNPGCRDPRPPGRSLPVLLPGQLYFALESTAWTGGVAFHDPLDPGEMPAVAHLVSGRQFSDIAAQETRRGPGEDLDLRAVLAHGLVRLGPEPYRTLYCPGLLDGRAVLTFTAPWRSAGAALNSPAAAYLGHLAAGLREVHGWGAERIGEYLSGRPGAAGAWSAAEVAGLPQAGGRPERKIPGPPP
ncbi:histone deacetylase [Kitasatospora sp. NBC_00315]|uniref:histone deacetylase n=1 Tax=Kitasatospora sp. NBC_00315 TaxID=2975963 RepID=UPI003245BA2E